jgi:uncharacterized protein with von Willebrand factor type A (vWA) domain
MDMNDLLKSLGLDEKPKATKTYQDIVKAGKPKPAEEVVIDTVNNHAITMDEYDIHRGAQAHRTCPNLRTVSLEAAQDFYAAAYKADPEVQVCVEPRRQQYIETLLESPEYKALRTSTMLNEMTSEMAACEFALQYKKLQEEDKSNERKDAKRGREVQEARADMRLHKAVGTAIAKAAEDIEELEQCGSALGMGKQDGSNAGMDPRKIVEVYNRVKNNHRLKRIIDLAGRYRLLARSKQRQKQTHGFDDMIGVEMSDDIGRLLPVELAKLNDEDLELDTLRRLVEKQTLCRQYQGVENVGKGPVIFCVDESGSMDGEPIANAKAFALAMAWVARHQKRWIGLTSFASSNQGRYLWMPPNKWDEVKLCEWLAAFFDGGTDLNVPCREIPRMFDTIPGLVKGKTDMIILTDGMVDCPMEKEFNAWKQKEQVKVHSIILGYAAGGLESISDEVHLVHQLGVDSDAVGQCLSI